MSATQGPVSGNVGLQMDDEPIQANCWDCTLCNMLGSTSLVLCVSGRLSPLPKPPVKPSQLSATAGNSWMEMFDKERGTDGGGGFQSISTFSRDSGLPNAGLTGLELSCRKQMCPTHTNQTHITTSQSGRGMEDLCSLVEAGVLQYLIKDELKSCVRYARTSGFAWPLVRF